MDIFKDVPLEFDLLASKTEQYLLNGFAPGFVDHEIVNQTPGSLIYCLKQDTFGKLGTIAIFKQSGGHSTIQVIFNQTDHEELREKAEQHQTEVISGYLLFLYQGLKMNDKVIKSPGQKGRYRLTPKEIKYRKNKAAEGERMKALDPSLGWKEIAKKLDNIPERTLRGWRHDLIKK